MKYFIGIAVCCLSMMLVGCGEKTYSVEYYKSHPQAQKAMLKKCRAMSLAESSATKNCAHVDEAIRQGKPKKNMDFSKIN